MATMGIFRIFVPVTDIEKALNFYTYLLDDAGIEVHAGRHYFNCGGVILAVIENNGSPISDHIYFSTDELEGLHARATELRCLETDSVHGSPSGEINVRPWRERSFYCRDPFGNGLCFVDSTTLFTGVR